MNPHQHQQTNGCYYFTESNDPYSFSVQTTSTLYYNKRATENCESLYANDATAAVLPAVNVSSTELTSTHEMTYTQHPSTLSNNSTYDEKCSVVRTNSCRFMIDQSETFNYYSKVGNVQHLNIVCNESSSASQYGWNECTNTNDSSAVCSITAPHANYSTNNDVYSSSYYADITRQQQQQQQQQQPVQTVAYLNQDINCNDCVTSNNPVNSDEHGFAIGKIEKRATTQRPYVCPQCGKSFVQKEQLFYKSKLLQRLAPTTTTNNNKSISDCVTDNQHLERSLKAHRRTHSGEKPFSCPICNRLFTQTSSLMTHKRTHTGEKPYHCPYCVKAFSDNSTLTKHVRTHTGQKPYQCRICYMNCHSNIHVERNYCKMLFSSFETGSFLPMKKETDQKKNDAAYELVLKKLKHWRMLKIYFIKAHAFTAPPFLILLFNTSEPLRQ
ncbi:Transcription factor che-1 [Trichinella spiralis]|uniref:Transcription factor che-1 n=1 Tax=Trichinella spiralis TaxID=6334 RepID=A0A0V1AXD4_TRISP|nr:Transcription factor che-1 [Trichinella spiralis]